MKTMADVRRIVDLYELHKSYKKVARELNISRNTVKKYLHQVKDVQEGLAEEIIPKNRKIVQPSRVLTDLVRQKIHQYLESNLGRPKKQRLTAKRIWELLIQDGHKIGYTSVKDEVVRWKRTNGPREVFILQEPRVGQRAEFDWGEVTLNIAGVWQKFYLAVFVLPFSLYRFARLYHRSARLEMIQPISNSSAKSAQFPMQYSMTEWLQHTILESSSSMINFWNFLCISVFSPVFAIQLHLTRKGQTKKV